MDRILIGKKTKNIEPGYVWVPYIIEESVPIVVDSNFNPSLSLKNRYGVLETKQQRRSKKIKKILENAK
jgi:hypothetical protein